MCHCISVYCIEMLPWYWNVYWYEDSWLCCRNGSWCGCIARRIWNLSQMIFRELIGGKCLCDATDIIIWYIVYVGPCGIMGPWVKVPKALEDDTLMWVYGVGPALGYESQKTRGMTCPWVMSQNSHYYIDRVFYGALISAV